MTLGRTKLTQQEQGTTSHKELATRIQTHKFDKKMNSQSMQKAYIESAMGLMFIFPLALALLVTLA